MKRGITVADDIYYIDDYLDIRSKINLETYLRNLQWNYQPLAAFGYDNMQGNMEDALFDNANGYFCNVLYYVEPLIFEKLPEEIMPLLKRLEPTYLGRIKCNLYIRASEAHAQHDFHTDYDGGNHPAMVWCADSADTGIEFKRDDGSIDFVATEANRAIFFNSAVLHRTTCPIHAKERVTININYQ